MLVWKVGYHKKLEWEDGNIPNLNGIQKRVNIDRAR